MGPVRPTDALQSAREAIAILTILLDQSLKEHMASGLLHELDIRIERGAGLSTRKKVCREVKRHIMGSLHAGAQPTRKKRHVDEAHHGAPMNRSAHVHVIVGRKHSRNSAARTIRLE